jgi:hypothetical protein
MKQYWNVLGLDNSIILEMRARLAWKMIDHYGIVSCATDKEDSQGRARLDLLSPEQVVNRAFAIADVFVSRCEEREAIRETTLEEVITVEETTQKIRRGIELESFRKSIAEKDATRKELV